MELATGYMEELRVKILPSEDRTGGLSYLALRMEVGIICAIQRGIFVYTRIVYVVFTLEIGANWVSCSGGCGIESGCAFTTCTLGLMPS